jgi:hypothetical protein
MSSQFPAPLDFQSKVNMPFIQERQSESKQDSADAAQTTDRIRVKNRRKIYLDRHPEYFTSPDLELSGASTYTQLTIDRLTYVRSAAI